MAFSEHPQSWPALPEHSQGILRAGLLCHSFLGTGLLCQSSLSALSEVGRQASLPQCSAACLGALCVIIAQPLHGSHHPMVMILHYVF